MLCALIMAGGKGTRFWPLSTEEKPKQFLNLIGEDTMIQMTVKRLEKLIPIERIFVVTGKRYIQLVKEQLPDLPETNIIIEPIGRNTAPCIALSAFHINKIYDNATIAVLPSDHLIRDEKKYIDTLKVAHKFINKNRQAIVTIGIKPDRPETGYGYINYKGTYNMIDGYEIMKINKFVEKPDIDKAREYLDKGNYLWNAGMFIWKAENILRLTCKHLKNTFDVLSEVATATAENYEVILESKYNDVECISVDYGIMEKEDNIYVVPGEFGWDDVGNWTSLERYREKDGNNNVCVGHVKVINGSNNIVVNSNKSVIINELDDILVIESNENIIVSSKKDISKIKDLIN